MKSKTTLWNPQERKLLASLRSPEGVQQYLDNLPYNAKESCYSPRFVMNSGAAHCMEGALFAAAALEFLGYKPLIVDLIAQRDDDHIIAIYKRNGKWGCVAKSNYTGLRYRSPVYRTLRELALSFFDDYFNVKQELTLRGYSPPLLLSKRHFGKWQIREDDLYDVSDHFEKMKQIPLITKAEVRSLRRVDDKLYRAGLLGSNPKGLYKIKV
ncbi:MAG: hypothetical protein V1799_13755 [bacterium]